MKESTFYYLMQELKIESECSDNKGEEYPSAFADKYNTYYQIAHSYVTGLVPDMEEYAREECMAAGLDFEKFRMHHQSFLDLLNVTEQGKRNKEMILRYIWKEFENSKKYPSFLAANISRRKTCVCSEKGWIFFAFDLEKLFRSLGRIKFL